MIKTSAGLLMYKIKERRLKVFLVHPGGPFWKGKDEGAWDIPKGQVEDGENERFETARREMKEETGIDAPKEKEKYIDLGSVKHKSGKEVYVWAYEGDWSGLLMGTSYVTIENPPRSGKFIKFLEVDKADFFEIEVARKKIYPYLKEFLDRLEGKLKR